VSGRRIERGVVPSILETDIGAAVRALDAIPPGCALVELRADRLRAGEIGPFVDRSPLPVIVTVKERGSGGHFDGSTEERRAILEAGLGAGAAFVDVEWRGSLFDLALGPSAGRVVLSDHGSPCDPAALRATYRAMASTPAARLKIVPRASSSVDACAVRLILEEARSDGRELASFTEGRGSFTRIFALSWGSWGTYAAVTRPTGGGQLGARDLLEVFRVGDLSESTRRHALVGRGVDASPSPALHAAAYRESGIDAVLVPIEAEAPEDVLSLLEPGALGIEGLAVTIPLKEAMARRCALRDEVSRRATAVNTVRVGPDGLDGFNTDGPAARDLILAHLAPSGAAIAVVGAGGTGRAVAAALASAGASVTLYGRERARVDRWARAMGIASGDLASLGGASWDVLVQATPLGRFGERVVSSESLRGRVVLDAVYGAVPTPLVRDARARGVRTIDGFDLLVAQAVLQIERLTERRVERSVLERALGAWRASRPPLDGDLGPE
jgi:shikimate dehydrogenase